jgi:hypothetical protein
MAMLRIVNTNPGLRFACPGYAATLAGCDVIQQKPEILQIT